ncbi:MAG: GDP-mannose 4,6-dehydratase [Deltaproteobacteria bacterium]|nr:GDP-mannose 4,6-dehydratase [Deltaproteobacteria bacterium]MCX7952614.1 GDP-mannose 4,6-dehydratase [Deltaproteobacteria bacterium]
MEFDVLVTGCGGFLGSWVAERLVQDGLRVVGIDFFTDNYPREIKENNLKNLSGNPSFQLIEKDLAHLSIDDLKNKKIAHVIHLAAQPGVRDSWGPDFVKYIHNNVHATQNLLEVLIRINSFKRLIYASSSSVYGEPPHEAKEQAIKETSLTNPYSPYGVTKLTAEKLCQAYSANYGFELVSLRFFTVYGPRQRPDMAFSRFIRKAIRGEPIVIYGDGSQKRDFTFVEDAIEAVILSLKKGSGVYNVGRGKTVPLKEALNVLRDHFPELKVAFEPKQKGDVSFTWADISKIQAELGYSPKVDLQEGLERQIQWIRSNGFS